MTHDREVVGSNPLDGIDIFLHWFVVKIVLIFVCLKRPKINEKEAGVGPFFKKIFAMDKIINCSNINWSNVNWSKVNWSKVNWSNVNWSNVNWPNVIWPMDSSTTKVSPTSFGQWTAHQRKMDNHIVKLSWLNLTYLQRDQIVGFMGLWATF